jgi:putative hydrolase of the HAD superfamily
MRYKHLFFDLDHTLWDFDTASERCWRSLYETFQLEAKGIQGFDIFFEDYTRHNDRLWERFRNGQMARQDLRWKRIWYTLIDHKVTDMELAQKLSAAYLELLPACSVLMPNAREVLDYCGERYSLHLITNGFEETQRLKLANAGIDGYFEELITSEISNSMKPKPEIFQYALDVTGAKVEESLMIGDALEIDVMGAMNFGMDAVYFNPEKLPHKQKPTYEVSGLQELTHFL